jgi:hypothetical protein
MSLSGGFHSPKALRVFGYRVCGNRTPGFGKTVDLRQRRELCVVAYTNPKHS